MAEFKAVSISNAGYVFCRFTVAIIFWIAVILQMKELVLAGFVILLLSALLKVRRAPLIWIYTETIDKIFPSKKIIVDEKGIRFAHIVGTVVSFVCLFFLYIGNPAIGWTLTVFLAILKTSAAFGFCSALKLYNCMNAGTCCRIGKLMSEFKNDR